MLHGLRRLAVEPIGDVLSGLPVLVLDGALDAALGQRKQAIIDAAMLVREGAFERLLVPQTIGSVGIA